MSGKGQPRLTFMHVMQATCHGHVDAVNRAHEIAEHDKFREQFAKLGTKPIAPEDAKRIARKLKAQAKAQRRKLMGKPYGAGTGDDRRKEALPVVLNSPKPREFTQRIRLEKPNSHWRNLNNATKLSAYVGHDKATPKPK